MVHVQGAIEIPINTTLAQEVLGLYDKTKVLPDRKHVTAQQWRPVLSSNEVDLLRYST